MATLPEVESTWTPEKVYDRPNMRPWPPSGDEDFLKSLRVNPRFSPFKPEFLDSLMRETTWLQITTPSSTRPGPPAPDEKCAQCDGKGKVKVLYRGEITGIITSRLFSCDCGRDRRFFCVIEQATPARFRDVRLASLSPSNNSILPASRQAEIIATLQARPDDSYFLYGTPGTGKSHMSTAIFHQAVWRSVCVQFRRQDMQAAVWRVSAATLLREHKDWETRDKNGDVEIPTVTERAIRNAAAKGYRPCLFIDEIDKFSTTEFRINTLAEIVDAVYVAEGQIVATSNKSPADLEAKWGSNEAGTILRRIGSEVNAHMVEFG